MQISMHIITQDRQEQMLRLLTATKGYFDVIRVCDGGSTDRTVDICKMFGCKVIQRRWDDNMASQHNILLGSARKGEFIFIMDDDEVPSMELLGKLREYAEASNRGGEYRIVQIPSIMAINGITDWDVNDLISAIQDGKQTDRFRKQNFFYYDGEIKFSGESHYGLEYEHMKDWGRLELIPEPYIHYKEPIDIVQCNIQQAFINPTMQGMKMKDGVALRKMFAAEGITDSRSMLAYLRTSHVSKDLKDWFVARRDPILGTESDFFEYYFLYCHPEQLAEYADAMDNTLKEDPAVIRHLKDLGGYRSYTVDVRFADGTEHWLPIAHLGLHPDLWNMLDTNQVLVKSTRKKGKFDLDPFSEENKKEQYYGQSEVPENIIPEETELEGDTEST